MIEIEVIVPVQADLAQAEQLIEQCCAAEGLLISLKGSLASYPGCIHWHYKQGTQRGTLEITLWPKAGRIWFSVHSGRTAAWIEEAVARLKETLEKNLALNERER